VKKVKDILLMKPNIGQEKDQVHNIDGNSDIKHLLLEFVIEIQNQNLNGFSVEKI